MSEMKFEEAIKKLEKIVLDLERGDIPLEASLAKYEEGIALAHVCQKRLENTRSKIEMLVMSKDAKATLEPFSGEDISQEPAKEKKKKKRGEDLLF